ncbi:MAG: GspH/FimT family pseudopilin [Rhodoferax sp.]|uniref:GspH/FimT family pseudopilin n=1 Tax=Rhodoferax sp. TaxID=50421 RepID=UPI002ACDE783|nr:GspH/FimT family pseudopilin [Rhodoferax sp.]MDZ7892001.1 GspH/FimT family pseudopilin [Rhodoferax sp.]
MKIFKRPSRGFTLIELLVTLTIAATLAAVAVPSVQSFLRNNELTAASSTLLTAINTARMEAIKSGQSTMLEPVDSAGSWSQGWIVFVDKNRNQTYTSGTDTLITQHPAVSSYFTVVGNNTATGTTPYILFDASGYAKTKANAFGGLTLNVQRNDVSGAEQLAQTRRVIIANTGRARVCKPQSDTDANCKASDTASDTQ